MFSPVYTCNKSGYLVSSQVQSLRLPVVMKRTEIRDEWKHSFMQRPNHPSFGWVKLVVDGRNMDGQVVDGCQEIRCCLSVMPEKLV